MSGTETLEIIAEWRFVADTVMGGVSRGAMRRQTIGGREAVRLTGDVSLENNGGFIQIAADLATDGGSIDASAWSGLEVDVLGNGETYNIHLRSADVSRPWQSYRQSFVAADAWRSVRLSFSDFAPHRIEQPLDLTRLRRVGIVAIGRPFDADVAVAALRFYR